MNEKISKLFTLFIVTSLLFCGCGGETYNNMKPDDELSKAIRKAIGNDLYYRGRNETDDYGVEYDYLVTDFGNADVETISGFVDTIDELLKDQQGKVTVVIFSYISSTFYGQCNLLNH